jgi:hypothetical protein
MDFITERNMIYVCADEKIVAEVTFPNIDDNTVDINHTFVDPSLRGQGMAQKLLILAYQTIKEQGYKAIVTCPYAVKFFNENKSYQDILK